MLAESLWLRMRGLLGRDQLADGEGLLLRPASSIHMFFMRFPIDAVFLDRELNVLRVRAELAPLANRGEVGSARGDRVAGRVLFGASECRRQVGGRAARDLERLDVFAQRRGAPRASPPSSSIKVTVHGTAPGFLSQVFGISSVSASAAAKRTGGGPYALFSYDTSCSLSMSIGGNNNIISGATHSNGILSVTGHNNVFGFTSCGGPGKCPGPANGGRTPTPASFE